MKIPFKHIVLLRCSVKSVGEDDVNTAVDDSKWKVEKSKGRCNTCKKLGHFARECKTPEFIIQKMKGNSSGDISFDLVYESSKKNVCPTYSLPTWTS